MSNLYTLIWHEKRIDTASVRNLYTLIDDVYESTWHWYTTSMNRYTIYVRSMRNLYTSTWHQYRFGTRSAWYRHTVYKQRVCNDMSLGYNLYESTSDLNTLDVKCIDIDMTPIKNRHSNDMKSISVHRRRMWIDMALIYNLYESLYDVYPLDAKSIYIIMKFI